MAKTRFEYVRDFEECDRVCPNVYMVVRIDGKGFHKFSDTHQFEKPNDRAALDLMNCAAKRVMQELKPDVSLAFGESDEYSFMFRRDTKLYSRRRSKLTTTIVSIFTAAYVFYWPQYFPNRAMQYPPSFDGRLVWYPTAEIIRDYFSWRQADTHINNVNNTTYWALVLQGGKNKQEAHNTLKGTMSEKKQIEILFSTFGVSYGKLPAMFRQGTTLLWSAQTEESDKASSQQEKDFDSSGVITSSNGKSAAIELRQLHRDIIKQPFWDKYGQDIIDK